MLLWVDWRWSPMNELGVSSAEILVSGVHKGLHRAEFVYEGRVAECSRKRW